MFLFITLTVFSIGMLWIVSHIFCLVYGLHGVWIAWCMDCMVSGVRFREADTCTLYPLMFNCRGGGWYVMCAKAVAVIYCVGIVLIRILYSLFLDERLFVQAFCVWFCVSLEVHEHLVATCLCGCAVVKKCSCG